jgi:hypothetical protein
LTIVYIQDNFHASHKSLEWMSPNENCTYWEGWVCFFNRLRESCV